MYIDRKLAGPAGRADAVAPSTARAPDKRRTFILDFQNEVEEIKEAIVKRIARKNFLRVNEKDFDALPERFAFPASIIASVAIMPLAVSDTTARLCAYGSPASGRLGKHLTITVQDVWVKGLPNDTTIIIRWSATDQIPDGKPYNNRGVHIVKMRWGKIVDIDAHEDSQAVMNNLARQAALGVAEATAHR